MQKKVPMLPLFVADALMFLAVFLIALPNIFLKEPLDVGQTFALVAVVVIAMFVMLVPLLINYRTQTKNSELNASQEIQQIFADLRTLRDSLMEQIKKIDIAGEEIEKLNLSLLNLQDAFNSLKDKSNENSKFADELNALNNSIATLKDDLKNLASNSNQSDDINAIKEELENLTQKTEDKFQIIDEICAHLQTLAEEENQEFSQDELEIKGDDTTSSQDLFQENEDYSEQEEEIEEQIQDENLDEDFEEELDEDFGKDDEIQEPETQEELEEDFEEDEAPAPENKIETKGNPKWSGMLDKAFQNSQSFSTRETVSRFIEKNKQGDAPEESNGVEAPLNQTDASDPASSISIDDLEKTETFKEVDEGVKAYEEKITKENLSREDMLFSEDEIPEKHKPSRLKNGDTAVVVNAFLGIGNMPYIRGNGAGLNPEKGIAMDLLEIGKYQWKCESMLAEPVKISIWLNDEIPSTLGELTLNPNETLDVEPTF